LAVATGKIELRMRHATFKEEGSFQKAIASFIDWLDERFPVRSEIHEQIGYDS
jgi:hypothetical protein